MPLLFVEAKIYRFIDIPKPPPQLLRMIIIVLCLLTNTCFCIKKPLVHALNLFVLIYTITAQAFVKNNRVHKLRHLIPTVDMLRLHILPVKFTAAALSAMVCFTAAGGDSSPAYNFLNITSSAHAYGLGGVNISTVEEDVNLVDQNPALIGPEMEMQLGFNYMRYLGDSNFAGVKWGSRASDKSAYAVGLQYFGYGDIKSADETGAISGKFSPKDVYFFGAYSHDITDKLRGGITLKYVYSAYEQYSAMALATDIGINYYNADHDLSLSAVMTNLGGQIKRFDESYDRLPIDLRLGWTQQFGNFPVRWSITAWNLTKWRLPYYDIGDGTEPMKKKDSFMSNLMRHLVFGADIVPGNKFHVSIGYNYKTRTDMSTHSRNLFSGIYLGAGLKVSMFTIDLAYSQPHGGGSTLMLNLSTNLYEFKKPRK